MDPLDDPTDPPEGWARDHVHTYVATNGEDPQNGHDWLNGATVLLLTTLGRQSGQARRTPLIYGRHGDQFLLVASKGGSDQAPQWYENLSAHPRVRLQVKGEVFDAEARTADAAQRGELWPIMVSIWPQYDEYQRNTDRQIPIVVLDRLPVPPGSAPSPDVLGASSS